MKEKPRLKLLVIYDASKNEYSLAGHNQDEADAKAFAERWNPHLVSGCTLIVLDQSRRHQAAEASRCRACRETVARSANLNPQPRFVRREL